ncbi:MAG: beta-xylosidase [Methylocystis sp.]
MIEAAMIWNEPNNKSHWDPELDPDWALFAEMAILAGQAIRAENAQLTRVLGGISPIDPGFIANMQARGVLDHVDAVAVHGFPLDWNLWQIQEWPIKIAEIEAITDLPVWVSEVGVSSFGADEVQTWGLERTAELLKGRAPRLHWYSLFDLPEAWGATTRHKEAEGSSYYRHFHMGLIRADGTPKPALDVFARHTPALGLVQWFHFEDPRLDEAVAWMKRLGVTDLRTGLSWADSFQPGAEAFFDRLMRALEDFNVTVTFCFTPEHRGLAPHHTSAPVAPEEFAEFCARMIRRYAGAARPTDVRQAQLALR